jgi:hypothetical protein
MQNAQFKCQIGPFGGSGELWAAFDRKASVAACLNVGNAGRTAGSDRRLHSSLRDFGDDGAGIPSTSCWARLRRPYGTEFGSSSAEEADGASRTFYVTSCAAAGAARLVRV